MAAAAFNLGPATVCDPHRDGANLSFGICSITALGHFDSERGGHLVLEELDLVIEFPPGSTILIPSAILTHWNTKISEGEKRYSFTQYSAGALFSYVENGMMSNIKAMEDATWEELEVMKYVRENADAWQRGLALFPHISDYADDSM
jgi:hypothetical protein